MVGLLADYSHLLGLWDHRITQPELTCILYLEVGWVNALEIVIRSRLFVVFAHFALMLS